MVCQGDKIFYINVLFLPRSGHEMAPVAPDSRPTLTVTTIYGVTETLPTPWVDTLTLELDAFAAGAPAVSGEEALAVVAALS